MDNKTSERPVFCHRGFSQRQLRFKVVIALSKEGDRHRCGLERFDAMHKTIIVIAI
jgi:hypothetical protein